MIGIGNLTHHNKVTVTKFSPYQALVPITANKETKKTNGSIFTIENGIKSNKSDVSTKEDVTSQSSSKDNVFKDSNCYLLYLFGKAWQAALEKLPPSLKCCCISPLVCT